MLEAIIEPIVCVVGRILLWIVANVLMYPLFCILLTPFVLISAFFGSDRTYFQKVSSGYKSVCDGVTDYVIGFP